MLPVQGIFQKNRLGRGGTWKEADGVEQSVIIVVQYPFQRRAAMENGAVLRQTMCPLRATPRLSADGVGMVIHGDKMGGPRLRAPMKPPGYRLSHRAQNMQRDIAQEMEAPRLNPSTPPFQCIGAAQGRGAGGAQDGPTRLARGNQHRIIRTADRPSFPRRRAGEDGGWHRTRDGDSAEILLV